jgi:hypothetical protein
MKVFLYELSIPFSTQRHISAMHIVICSILHAPCVQITNIYLIYIPKKLQGTDHRGECFIYFLDFCFPQASNGFM